MSNSPKNRGGRPREKFGARAKLTGAQVVAAVRAGQVMPLPVMLELLQDALSIYRAARAKVLTDEGLLQANAADHMEEVVARMQNVMEVAKAAAPFVHPKLATVGFVAPGEQPRMVVRLPEVAKSAEEWTQQNQRRLGLTEIELDPLKKPN